MGKAAMIFPGYINQELKNKLKEHDITFYSADIPQSIKIAKECEAQGVDVIISRAGLEAAIKKAVNVPVVNCEVTHVDVVNSILSIKKEIGSSLKEMGLCNYASVTYDIQYIEKITDIKIKQFWYWDDPFDLKKCLIKCKDEGIEVVLGANMTIKYAKELGMKGYMKQIGQETLAQAIQKAQEIITIRQNDLTYAEKIKNMLSFAREGILFVNKDNKIDYINPRAIEILGKNYSEFIGKPVCHILPGWLNKKEGLFLDEIAKISNDNKIIYNRVPVKVANRDSGSVVTFTETAQIQKVEEKIRKFLHDKGFAAKHSLEDIVGESKQIKESIKQAKQYAKTDFTVLITGETGTGKELFAHGIHRASLRSNHPFVAINCAALPENLLESELFGYEEGAFTGARKGGKPGYFELAHRGTIFLDEIGELKLPLQGKLLRVIQSKEVMRIGGDRVIPVDTRIIAATNCDLLDLVNKKKFRSDLYYRLNVLNLNTSPLRVHKDDIVILAKHFINKFKQEHKVYETVDYSAFLEGLQQYDWPGNVRELECMVARYCILSETIDYSSIKQIMSYPNENKQNPSQSKLDDNIMKINIDTLDKMTDEIYSKIYKMTDYNKLQTAKMLGINRMTIYKWLERKKE